MASRIGIGYDIHPFSKGRPFILGGVEIPYERGLKGHSDADVLTHAVIDALLGALGEGSIGEHFPDTDPVYRGISSLRLLEKVVSLCKTRSCDIIHVDATIICEQPKLLLYFPAMKERLVPVLGVPVTRMNLKAKRNEGLGALGRGEGVAAMAVCLLDEILAR